MNTAESVVRQAESPLSSTDRREHKRAPLDAPALVDNLKTWQPARCKNVSMGGVAVACGQFLPVGEVVEIYFELPNGFAVEARAQVVRSDGDEMGLRFLSIGPRSLLAVRSHCNRIQLDG